MMSSHITLLPMESPTKRTGRSVFFSRILVVAIVLLGFFFRSLNIDWDQSQHLHPDERFLTMVMGNMMIPASFISYLNPDISTFNPVNVGNAFYVYGIFPLVLTKFMAIALQLDNYVQLTLVGRWLSAGMDSVGILVIMLITRRFEKLYKVPRNLKYFVGLFYAISVFPIQQAHFFTVDTFANTFFLLSFLFAVKTDKEHFIGNALLSGTMMGIAVACKINIVLAAPLIGWLLVSSFLLDGWRNKKFLRAFLMTGLLSILWFLSFWIALRLSDPYYFARFSLVDWHLNTAFVNNIAQLESFSDPNGYFPPGIQWVSKTKIIFPLVNIAIFGLGLPLFFFTLYGTGKMILFALKDWIARLSLFFTLAWMLVFFIYEGMQFVLTMRYFLFLYPLFALMAGFGIMELGKHTTRKAALSHRHHEVIIFVSTLLCFIWPLMFISVYLHKHSRVEASEWIYRVLPDKSTLTLEHWDDPLPLNFEGVNPEQKIFEGQQLPVFYPDEEVKWKEMNEMFAKTDYYILTSNRTWGSIMAAPEKYPRMAQFYQDLFDGKTQFKLIKEFNSYPSLSYLGLPITLNDDWAEEAFTVYDHPKVLIFVKKENSR